MILSFAGKSPRIAPDAYIAPGVVLIGDLEIESSASVWFQSVLRADINSIYVGEASNIQDACLLHVTRRHECRVGKRVTVGHGAILHGCSIGDDCLIAMGAIVLDGAVIENNCLIGAGTLVPPNMKVKSGSLLLGSPAKVVRELNDEDLERIKQGWQNYVDYAKQFDSEIKSQKMP